ncbi:hypothetical protein TrRE_jg4360 [Triparma retinervis]|uniref:Uncharacterized protein n=1 Tax=Triparma retinervis TaxID=2557542 RepID=A0A9W7FBE9_9STRA|nr:hypothetical protein TrRE_jg4360 [Triparma retinervis]
MFGFEETDEEKAESSPTQSPSTPDPGTSSTPDLQAPDTDRDDQQTSPQASPKRQPLTPSRPPLLNFSENLPPTPFGATTVLSDLSTETANLEHVRAIILSDQNILDVKGIELDRFSSLSMLNLSFNSISTLTPLSFVSPSSYSSFLTNLDVSHNKLTSLSGVESLPSLKVLRASNNKIEEVSSLCDLTSLEELWLSRNVIDAPQLLNLTQLPNLLHFIGSSNPWCSHEHYKIVLLSMFENCQTFDCRPVEEDDLDEAAEFAVSTDGKGVFHKLKFTILQSENHSYFKQKVSNKEANTSTSGPSKTTTTAAINPIPKSPPGATLATASISDCLSLLPSFGDEIAKIKKEKAVARRKVRKKPSTSLPPKTGQVKFKPVSWQGSINSEAGHSPHSSHGGNAGVASPRVMETIEGDNGTEPSHLVQGDPDPGSVPSPPRPVRAVALPFKKLYTKGGVGIESKSDGTAYAKWPSGGHAINRDSSRLTCTYSSGRVAVTFDDLGNGSVYYPDGKTALSLSPQECLFFRKVEGTQRTSKTKFDIVPLNSSSGQVRIPLHQSVGVDFCASPLRIEVYFKVKNIHCKFVAPGTEGGQVVVPIERKGDLFGERERVKKVKEEVVPLEHGDFLSAIQRAVAGL